jgi:hypothetical protein
MTDEGQDSGARPGGEEPLGSVAEEAAKLLDALQGWAREGGGEAAGAAAAGLGGRLKDIDEHLATGGAECTWCPVCRAVAVVRQTSPEVRTHLATAASSLLQAAAGLLDAHAQGATRPASGVQKIDLDEATEWPDDGGWNAD